MLLFQEKRCWGRWKHQLLHHRYPTCPTVHTPKREHQHNKIIWKFHTLFRCTWWSCCWCSSWSSRRAPRGQFCNWMPSCFWSSNTSASCPEMWSSLPGAGRVLLVLRLPESPAALCNSCSGQCRPGWPARDTFPACLCFLCSCHRWGC